MALDLEAEGRIVGHHLRDAFDFARGFRLDGGFAGVEGDGVGHDLAVGGQAVIQRHGTFGDADVAPEIQPFIIVFARELQEPGRLGVGNVGDPLLVEIDFKGALVERNGDVVPGIPLEILDLILAFPDVAVGGRPLIVKVLIGRVVIARRIDMHIQRHFVRVAADAMDLLFTTQIDGIAVQAQAVAVVDFFGKESFLPNIDVEFHGAFVGQVNLAVPIERRDRSVLRIDHFLSVEIDDFRRAAERIPHRREFAELLLFHRVFEDDLIAGHEVIVVPADLGGRRFVVLRRGRQHVDVLLGDGLFDHHLLVARFDLHFLGTPGLVARLAIEGIVDAFFNLVADVVLNGVLRPVLQAVQHVALRRRPAAHQQEGRHQ